MESSECGPCSHQDERFGANEFQVSEVAWASAFGGWLGHDRALPTPKPPPRYKHPREPVVQCPKRSLGKRIIATLYSSSAPPSEGVCGFLNPSPLPLQSFPP